MTKRTLILTDDDDPPWSGIRPPWSRIANPYRYLRAELAHVVCHDREFADSDAVVCRCPVLDGSAPHAVTLRGLCAREDVIASLKCSEGHASDEIIEAILDQLEEQE